ncbi:MAG: hypothetical protein QOE32_1 [Pseudonocardiales bacterium]|nr:hypothetical protein [Pseudonocardiales bacterium]
MPTVPGEPAATGLGPPARRAGLSWRRRLAAALTGLVVLPLLTLGLTQLRDVLNLPSQMLLYLLAVVVRRWSVGWFRCWPPLSRPRRCWPTTSSRRTTSRRRPQRRSGPGRVRPRRRRGQLGCRPGRAPRLELTDTMRTSPTEDAPAASAPRKPGGQREVAEMVGRELQLPAVGGRALRAGHHAGAVHQQMQRTEPELQPHGAIQSTDRPGKRILPGQMAEAEGFEPPDPLGTLAFKACASSFAGGRAVCDLDHPTRARRQYRGELRRLRRELRRSPRASLRGARVL